MVNRITGLASGMDIDSIVESMIKAKKTTTVDKYTKQKTLLEWKRDAYREVNTALLDFRTQLSNMKYTSYYRTRSVSSTNEDYVTATASSGAAKGSYTISEIKQLATAASKVNAGAISKKDSKFDTTKSLYSQTNSLDSSYFWKAGTVKTETITVKDSENISLNLGENGLAFNEVINNNQTVKDASHFSVEVDGKSFTVEYVEDATTAKPLETGKVYIDAKGNLSFNESERPKANSSVKVTYVTDETYNKTVSLTKNEEQYEIALDDVATNITLQINGKEYTQGSGENAGKIYDKDGNEVGKIDFANGKMILNKDVISLDDTTDLTAEISYQKSYADFSITTFDENGSAKKSNFLFQASDSLSTVISRVNSSKSGVTMFYDSYTDRVTITRNETGDFNTDGDEITTDGSFLNDVLKFNGVSETGGTNAKFTVNGLETERTSNTFSMNNVSFTLKKESTTPVTINISSDTDALYNNIKSFVDKYNEIVEKIESKLNEAKYKNYEPLTDDEREELSDTQQEKWEKLAKSGLLKNDSILSGLITKMRTSLYTSVSQSNLDPTMKSLSAIGITTTSDYTTSKIEINETKLKEAIAKDPDSVELLFNGSGTTTGEKGIAQRLYDNVNSAISQIISTAGSSTSVSSSYTIGKEIDDLEDRIDDWKDRLEDLEDRYYSQFEAMEKAIQKSNEQYSYLSQYFSS